MNARRMLGVSDVPITTASFIPLLGAMPRAGQDELKLVPPPQVPRAGTFYTFQHPEGPPLPCNPFPDLSVYSLGDGYYLIDDETVDYEALSALMKELGGPPMPLAMGASYDPGCAFHLSISAGSNAANLRLHNTRTGQTYTVWSIQDLTQTNWVAETNVTGAGGDFTDVVVAMGQRTNLFFKASENRDYVTNLVFEGLSFADTQQIPPDTMGAVGPNHFVELLNGAGANTAIAVYDKAGTLISQTSMTNFFAASLGGTNYPTGDMADPRILYDHRSERWLACAMQQTEGIVILAVSNDQNPTNLISGWTNYVLPLEISGYSVDFPTLGLDDNGAYIAIQQLSGDNIYYHTMVAIKKPEIYTGQLLVSVYDLTNDPPVRIIQPAVNFDAVATNDYAWFVAVGPPDLGVDYLGGEVWYRRLQWQGTNVAWDPHWFAADDGGFDYRDYYELAGSNILAYPNTGVGAPQAEPEGGAAINLYTMGSRLMNAVARNGVLWTCHMVGLDGTNGTYSGDASGASVDRSAIQWFKLDINAATLTLNDYGRVFDPQTTNGWWYHFPSLAVNCSGDMVLGFSGSGRTNYIGAFYTWRLGSGASLGEPRLLQEGSSVFDGLDIRWGDYSATTLDPADDWSFWTVQAYAAPWTSPSGFVRGYWETIVTKVRPTP